MKLTLSLPAVLPVFAQEPLHEFAKNVYNFRAPDGQGHALAVSRPLQFEYENCPYDGAALRLTPVKPGEEEASPDAPATGGGRGGRRGGR